MLLNQHCLYGNDRVILFKVHTEIFTLEETSVIGKPSF